MTDSILCPWCGAEMVTNGYCTGFQMTCPECGAKGPIAVLRLEVEKLTRERYAPPVKPLTLEELKAMNCEPVWIVEYPNWGHWELSWDAEDYVADRDEDFYGLYMPKGLTDPEGRFGLHVLGWLAYRSKPTDEERAAAKWEEG